MKGLPWGEWYNKHKDDKLNAAELEQRIVALIDDDEVNSKKGIYEYLLTGNEKTLSLRAFDEKTKQKIYANQKGICPGLQKHCDIGLMEEITLYRGARAARQRPTTADYFVRWITGPKAGSRWLIRDQCFHRRRPLRQFTISAFGDTTLRFSSAYQLALTRVPPLRFRHMQPLFFKMPSPPRTCSPDLSDRYSDYSRNERNVFCTAMIVDAAAANPIGIALHMIRSNAADGFVE